MKISQRLIRLINQKELDTKQTIARLSNPAAKLAELTQRVGR